LAYSVYARTSKGSAKSYLDTISGDIISARQYRNRVEASKSGYATLGQKQKATKYATTKHQKVGTVHRSFNLGKPQDIQRAVESTIERTKFGFGMYVTLHVLVTPEMGKPYERYVSSLVFKKDVKQVQDMLEDCIAKLDAYGEEYELLGWYLDIVEEL
jgi:hypothetical protein